MKMISKEVMAEYREQAKDIMLKGKPVKRKLSIIVLYS